MKKLRWLALLMGVTILGIIGFQGYWLNDNYKREKQNLAIRTNADFHQTILHLQASKLELDIRFDSLSRPLNGKVMMSPGKKSKSIDSAHHAGTFPSISMINLLQEKVNGTDSGKVRAYIFSGKSGFLKKVTRDSLDSAHGRLNSRFESIDVTSDSFPSSETAREIEEIRSKNPGRTITISYRAKPDKNAIKDSAMPPHPGGIFIEKAGAGMGEEEDVFNRGVPSDLPQRNAVVRFLYNIDSVSLKDSITIKEIMAAYSNKLRENKIKGLTFSVSRLDSNFANSPNPNDVTIGFSKPVIYRLSIDNEFMYLLKRLTLPILFSLLLVGITIISFVLLYRNLVRQRRLAELKNEFISNITHELKTPIATVGVAIEALKNFNAIHDPQRTREYLDISQSELERLGLLVDKVLKLSMFEKKEMELKKEQFDCKQLTEEVMNSMRLQFEKYHAKVNLHTEGDNFVVEADKLHITSVIYNVLDNALKYSRENPVIDVSLKSNPETLEFSVSDNGIGIASAYKEKVFDKFFRVPTGDKHNIKGYGLGLSYVAEVIKRHHGNVHVESELGKGSTFTATVPYA